MRLQVFPQTYLLWLKIIGQTMPVTNTADYERPIDHFLKPSVRLKADVSKISNLFFYFFFDLFIVRLPLLIDLTLVVIWPLLIDY